MGRFSDRHQNINKHSMTGGGIYWEPGTYRTLITGIKYIEKGHRGESYIIESEVLKVFRHCEAETRDKVKFNASRKVGDKVGHVIKLDKEPALGNIADFLRACFATMQGAEGTLVDPKEIEIDDTDVDASFAEDQPCVGLELEVYCYGIETKLGKPFVVSQYMPPEEYRITKAA